MKKYIICIIIIILTIFLKAATVDFKTLVVKKYLHEMNRETYQIKNYEVLKDFDDNLYYLYNFKPQGYAIFASNKMELVEGTFNINSIYENYQEEKFYLGPNNYYIKQNDTYYDLLTHNTCTKETLQKPSRAFYQLITTKNSNEDIAYDFGLKDDYVMSNNITYIKNYQYFKNLYDFPDNIEGSCGFVALAMILGYLDTYYDDNILDDQYIAQSRPYYSRGTKDELQYLLMNYNHYIKIPLTEIARAATARNLYDTFNDYRQDYIPISSRKNSFVLYHEGPLLVGNSLALKEIKYFINKGKPVILIMRSYTYQETFDGLNYKNSWHDVIAYGYSNDKFITHFGWGSRGANEYILNSVIIQSYIVIDYFN